MFHGVNDDPQISSIKKPAESTMFQLSFKIRSIIYFDLHGHKKLINTCIFFSSILALAVPFSVFFMV